MKRLRNLWFSLRALVLRDRLRSEIDEELSFHLERETRMLEQQGLPPGEARREAVRHFGGVQRYREECRDVQHVSWIDDLRNDVRFAIRLIAHHPGFSGNVILISGLGIAACVTTFSLVSGILLAPLSFSGQDRVFSLELSSAEGLWAAIPGDTYLRLAAGSPVFQAVTATRPTGATVDIGGEPTRLSMAAITPSFFRVYKMHPVVGRSFTDDEVATRAPVLLLGYDQWTTNFGADRDIVGKTIRVDGVPNTIVGVMPPRFYGNFEGYRFKPSLWVPFRIDPSEAVNPIVRITDGVDARTAEAWLRTVMHLRVEARRSVDSLAAVPVLVPVTERIYGDVKQPLMILLGAVLLVLILVAANVATMFLARAASRETELDVRGALGASVGRQFRQLITESMTLTSTGGLLGLAASYVAISVVRSLGQSVLPRMDNVGIDWRVLVFALSAVIATGCSGGVAHALAARRHRSRAAAGGVRVTGSRTSSMLVVVQVALSVVLLVGAGLLVKGFMRIAPTSPGFSVANRATVQVSFDPRSADPDTSVAGRWRLTSRIAARMRETPGVEDVAVTTFAPLTGMVFIVNVQPPGWTPAAARLTAYENVISPNYFAVMKIPLERGRALTAMDREGAEPVAVINETAAGRWFPGRNPIGQRVTLEHRPAPEVVTIVGVVRSSRMVGRTTRLVSELYRPLAQTLVSYATFIAATSGDPKATLPALRRAVREVAPRAGITESTDLQSTATESVSEPRFFSVAMSLFAVAALALSALGVYGLLSFAIAQRRREIGIRMALGATAGRIAQSVIGRAGAIGLAGALIGVILARALSKYMESLLTEVSATDHWVFALCGAGVFMIAILASCAPVMQAVRVDPVKSLRAE
jgi:predicted permease